MASFLLRKKQFLRFILIVSLCFTFYTFKWQRTESDTALTCDHLATNVAFIKTHKTASTSVAHLFLRYANKYQRLLAFFKDPFAARDNKFERSFLMKLKTGYNYNILADHTVFDYAEMRAVMPDDTTYITILRDPVAQFQSAYDYYYVELIKGINITTFANLNISDPEESKIIKSRPFGMSAVNLMANDLGIDPTLFDNETAILEKVEELDGQLDLVMIAELFDQSLILKKEKLCWKDWNDVIGFKINARKDANKTQLSSEQKEKLRRINRADQLIYDHFHEKMLREIDAFGKEKMEEEVRKLRRATEDMYELCVDEEATLKEKEYIMNEMAPFKLKQEAESHSVCGEITANLIQLWTSLFSKQKPFFAESELVLGLREVLYGYGDKAYMVLKPIQSFLMQHNRIISQLKKQFAFLSG